MPLYLAQNVFHGIHLIFKILLFYQYLIKLLCILIDNTSKTVFFGQRQYLSIAFHVLLLSCPCPWPWSTPACELRSRWSSSRHICVPRARRSLATAAATRTTRSHHRRGAWSQAFSFPFSFLDDKKEWRQVLPSSPGNTAHEYTTKQWRARIFRAAQTFKLIPQSCNYNFTLYFLTWWFSVLKHLT